MNAVGSFNQKTRNYAQIVARPRPVGGRRARLYPGYRVDAAAGRYATVSLAARLTDQEEGEISKGERYRPPLPSPTQLLSGTRLQGIGLEVEIGLEIGTGIGSGIG